MWARAVGEEEVQLYGYGYAMATAYWFGVAVTHLKAHHALTFVCSYNCTYNPMTL